MVRIAMQATEATYELAGVQAATQSRRKHRIFSFLALMLIAFSVHTFHIGRPFLPNNESTATAIPVMHAVNFARYGPAASRFAGILNTGQVEPTNWVVYAHHPPLVPLLIGSSYKVFGISEWSTRLFPVLFTLSSTVLIYLLALHRFGESVAFLAGFFYSCAPITVAFGGMPDYVNGQVVFFILASVATYLRWYETRRLSWLGLLSVSAILGSLTDWPIFFSGMVLYGHYLLNFPEQSLQKKIVPGFLMFLTLAGLLLWAEWAGQGPSIWASIYHRMIGDSGSSNLSNYIKIIITYNLGQLHTVPICSLALGFLAIIIVKLLNRQWSELRNYDPAILLLLIAALHLGLALQGNQQPWWSVILTAPLSMAAALCIESLRLLTNKAVIRLLLPLTAGTLFLSAAIPEAYHQLTFQWEHARSAGYTVKELGTVIRTISQPHEGVVTSDAIYDASLWFYSDRELRPAVTVISQLTASLVSGPYPLPYWYSQPDGPSPRWFVMPPPHRATLSQLAEELDARFPRRDLNGYSIYRLF